jgi:DNA-binding transcriptional MerR regulator
MSPTNEYIHLRKALKDYLKEQGVTLSDLLDVMDEERQGIMEALQKRVHLSEAQSRALQHNVRNRDLNLLLYVVQAFYLLNPSGMYKGFTIEPLRDDVVGREKATFEGCKRILKALRISTQGLNI